MKVISNIIVSLLTVISVNCCLFTSGIKSKKIKSNKKSVGKSINFQEIRFCGYYDVTKKQRDLDRLNFIFGFDKKTQSKYFSSKIRVFKFGHENRRPEVPEYIIIMLDEVKDRVINEEVKSKLFPMSGVNVSLCNFHNGLFHVGDVRNVVRPRKNEPWFYINHITTSEFVEDFKKFINHTMKK